MPCHGTWSVHGVSARSREPVSAPHKDWRPRSRLDRGGNPVMVGRPDHHIAGHRGSSYRRLRLRTTICAELHRSRIATLRPGGTLQEVGGLPNVFQRLLDRPDPGIRLPRACCYSMTSPLNPDVLKIASSE